MRTPNFSNILWIVSRKKIHKFQSPQNPRGFCWIPKTFPQKIYEFIRDKKKCQRNFKQKTKFQKVCWKKCHKKFWGFLSNFIGCFKLFGFWCIWLTHLFGVSFPMQKFSFAIETFSKLCALSLMMIQFLLIFPEVKIDFSFTRLKLLLSQSFNDDVFSIWIHWKKNFNFRENWRKLETFCLWCLENQYLN